MQPFPVESHHYRLCPVSVTSPMHDLWMTQARELQYWWLGNPSRITRVGIARWRRPLSGNTRTSFL